MSKIYFITQGCSANIADSEVMLGLLKEKHEIINGAKQADVIVINTCTVKGPTENEFLRKLKEFNKLKKKIILAGCIPQSQPNDFKEYSRIGTYQITKINKAVEETLKGNVVSFLERNDSGRLNLPKLRKNELIEIVPISQGCLNACSYCKTKHARGNLHSYEIKDIVRHISKAVEQGAKEIWLTSQDNSVYGVDIDTNLVELLKQILTIDRDFKLRVGMMNPKYLLNYLDKLVKIYKNPKVFKFIHIPVQVGSNKVLKEMNRDYKSEDFVKIVAKFRKEIPEISIATDIICGYPTETKEDFEETIDLIKKTKPDMINYSRFWPRPGTLAAKLKQIDIKEMKRRTTTIMNLFKETALENNKKLIGKRYKILITEKGKNNTFIGKNDSYKQVIIEQNNKIKIGQDIDVKIKEASHLDLKGEIV